jgi:hypothetical protein
MKIPKRFKLYGQTIEVIMDNHLDFNDDRRGEADYRNNKIRLQPAGSQLLHPLTHIEQAFLHELFHFIFDNAGYPDDRKDEIKIERLSNLLHQALSTAEYED